MVALQLIVKKTKMGKAMRAVSADSDAAELMGINVNNTISFTFALGSSLAGAAGVLIGLYYNSIEPLMGMTPGIKAFVAARSWWYRYYPWCSTWWICYRYFGDIINCNWFVKLP